MKVVRRVALPFIGTFCCLAFGQSATRPAENGPGRHALLVGNASYSSLPPLPAAVKELELMAAALRSAGFNVITVQNPTFADLYGSIVSGFVDQVRPGDVCLFYYSGYAFQGRGGDNYLLPADFDSKSRVDAEARAYPLARLEQDLEDKHAGLKMFVFEASRPLPSVLGLPNGLATPDPETKEFAFASAAQLNQTSESPPGDGPGLFTRLISRNLGRTPGMPLNEVFAQAQREVAAQTHQRQVPFYLPNFTTDFFFHDPERKLTIAQNRRDRNEYVLIPAGEFLMGCVASDAKCHNEEKPQHRVRISHSFWTATTDVDVTAFRRYLAQNDQGKKRKKGKMPPGPLWDTHWRETNHPIVNVQWDEAESFCAWAGGRLPTEAEWEYAARGGRDNDIYPLNDENSRDKANFAGQKGNDIFEYTSPVKSFDANSFQLFDMAGNVWEWMSDRFSATYYAQSEGSDPRGPASGKAHVIRGGSFDSDPKEHLRISFRKSSAKPWNNVGFRCVLDDTPEVHRLLQIP